MPLQFLADHCISNLIIHTLRNVGHQVTPLRDILPTDSPDTVVIAKAQEIGAILLSLNGDFADIVSYPPAKYLGIVSLQVRNHPEHLPLLLATLVAYLQLQPQMDYYRGKLLIAEAARIRVRG